MDTERMMHDMIVDRLRRRFTKEYREIRINSEGNPDIVLANYGLTVAVVEVETERSITSEKAGTVERDCGIGNEAHPHGAEGLKGEDY